MQLRVDCSLESLPDAVLEMFVSEPLNRPGKELGNPLVQCLHSAFQNEQIRRLKIRAGREAAPVTITIPLMSEQDIIEGVDGLTSDCLRLEDGAVIVDGGDPDTAAGLRAAAEFLCRVGVAVKSQLEEQRLALSLRPN